MSHKGCFQAQGTPFPPVSCPGPRMTSELPEQPYHKLHTLGILHCGQSLGALTCTSLLLFRNSNGGSMGSVSHPVWWRALHSAFRVRTPVLVHSVWGLAWRSRAARRCFVFFPLQCGSSEFFPGDVEGDSFLRAP